MKVALASAMFRNGDVAFNLRQMERHMRQAAGQGAALVCFGEAFLQGFDSLKWDFSSDCHMALGVDSAEFRTLCAWTRALRIDLLFGFLERDGAALYSSCALISGGALLKRYRRISRGWKEFRRTDGHYREGAVAEPFDYRGMRCQIALCGDLWDAPERFAQGEDVLFWPVYVDYRPEEWSGGERAEYAAQAAKARAKVLMINSLSADGGGHGGCCVFCEGKTLAELPMDSEGLLVVDV